MSLNVAGIRRMLGVQVLAGLGYLILEVKDAANEESNIAFPVY